MHYTNPNRAQAYNSGCLKVLSRLAASGNDEITDEMKQIEGAGMLIEEIQEGTTGVITTDQAKAICTLITQKFEYANINVKKQKTKINRNKFTFFNFIFTFFFKGDRMHRRIRVKATEHFARGHTLMPSGKTAVRNENNGEKHQEIRPGRTQAPSSDPQHPCPRLHRRDGDGDAHLLCHGARRRRVSRDTPSRRGV